METIKLNLRVTNLEEDALTSILSSITHGYLRGTYAVMRPSNIPLYWMVLAFTIAYICAKMYYRCSRWGRDSMLAGAILDNLLVDDRLAQEMLVTEQFVATTPVEGVIVGGIEIDVSPVKEKRHRRAPLDRSARRSYLKVLIAEVKAKVGTPIDKEANRMVIRRTARGIMDTHGVRPTHQASLLPVLIEAVLTPGEDELEALAWGRGAHVQWRRRGSPWSFWTWAAGEPSC